MEYPIQVTEFIPELEDVNSWNNFLTQKGHKTNIESKESKRKFNGKSKMLYALFRGITESEQSQIDNKQIQILGNTIRIMGKTRSLPKDTNVCTCSKCGLQFVGRGMDHRNFCNSCKFHTKGVICE